jgi:outer membrane protein assembly factor BamB
MHSASLTAALILAASTACAADWPRFRGPNGSGVADDPAVPVDWTARDILRKIPLPGRGNSSPVIVNGKLFLQAAGLDGNGRMMLCYDAKTLAQLWTANVAGGRGKTHQKNTLASSTPAADEQRVVGLFWDGSDISLHAFDHAGKPLWTTPLGRFTSQHGVGQSPVLFDGKVFLNNDQDGSAEFMAFDAASGKPLWSAKRTAYRSCYSSPFVMPAAGGGSDMVIASTAGVAAYDPASGKCRWQWEWEFESKPLRNVGSPVAGAGMVFAIAGDGDGSRHMVAVTIPGDGKAAAPKLAWEKKHLTPYVPCPLLAGEHIYWVSDTGFFACCEARSGRSAFDERFTSAVTASPILINGHVLAIDERGNAFTFKAQPRFEKPRKVALGENVYATPAVADGRLYIRGEQHLIVIGRSKPE